jgi:hypothetical protein
MEVYHPKGPNTSEGLEPPKIKPIMEEYTYTKVCAKCDNIFFGKGASPVGICEECKDLEKKIDESLEETHKLREIDGVKTLDEFKIDLDKEAKMFENIEHAIKNFNGRLVDCVAICDLYKGYLRQQEELDKQDEINHVLQSQLDVANAEKIMYKKIAEFLANEVKKDVVYYGKDGFDFCEISEEDRGNCTKHAYGTACIQCIIDWAKSEVENGTDN